MWTIFFTIGSILSGLAVGFGAFGAHALKGALTPEDAVIYDTASRYLTSQSLGIIGMALLMTRIDDGSLKIGIVAMTSGTIIFSGSLYLLVFTGVRFLGAITPIGGGLLIIGWLFAAWAALSTNWQ